MKPLIKVTGVPRSSLADWGEFAFIEALKKRLPPLSGGLRLGPGDDASWWLPDDAGGILTTADMLVAGVHFDLHYTTAASLGYKALAVNLSDLAAMGGKSGATAYLSLALPPTLEKRWLESFLDGFLGLAGTQRVQLAGGDTVRGRELVIAVTLNGQPAGCSPICRQGAMVGDDLYLSGWLGDSYLGLKLLQGRLAETAGREREAAYLRERHLCPQPRVSLGEKLGASGVVSAMLDVSDGLVADLGHLLVAAGGLGAQLEAERLPLSPAAGFFLHSGLVDYPRLLSGGEDYELLFTAPPAQRQAVAAASAAAGTAVTRIGRITAAAGVVFCHQGLKTALSGFGGYDHFRA
ncbi:MAG TPA: thiamine-phosphate kinase [Proteobacteria bacterium]|nr:thiamine-phosphate kinase [Pseudomonadota bacterium]